MYANVHRASRNATFIEHHSQPAGMQVEFLLIDIFTTVANRFLFNLKHPILLGPPYYLVEPQTIDIYIN